MLGVAIADSRGDGCGLWGAQLAKKDRELQHLQAAASDLKTELHKQVSDSVIGTLSRLLRPQTKAHIISK
jgi:hypothetical protein